MSKHGEPWTIDEHGYVIDCDGVAMFKIDAVDVDDYEFQKERMVRFVACVNALAGVPDPEAAVKAARTALLHAERSMKEMADTHQMDTPSSCAEIYALCAVALGMLGDGK